MLWVRRSTEYDQTLMIVCDVNMCVQGGELVWAIHRHAERPDPGIIFYDRFKTGYIVGAQLRVHSVHAAPRDVVQNVQKKDGVNTGVNENIDHNTTTLKCQGPRQS